MQIVHQAILKSPVAHALAESQVRSAPARDFTVQVIADHLRFNSFPVLVKKKTAGPTGTVIGYGQVVPFLKRQCLGRPDTDGVAWPEMDQGDRWLAVLEEQFVAPTAGIGPCLGPAQDHRSL